MNAYLELVIGPMYSGKSTMLIQRAERFERQGRRVLYVKYAQDKRYSEDSIATHSMLFKRAVAVMDLTEVLTLLDEVDVVVVDEGQFIGHIQLADAIVTDKGKVVIVAALDSDFRREPFKTITDLVAKADRVVKLSAVCSYCGLDAPFTHRTVDMTERELIGSHDAYTSLCRSCYRRSIK